MAKRTVVDEPQHDVTRLAGTEADQPQESSPHEPPRPTRGEHGYTLDVPVKLGTVSISDAHAAISVKVGKAGKNGVVGINLQTAEKFLCGARLDIALTADPDQQSFEGMEPETVYGIADVKTFGVTPKQIGFRLKFPLDGFNYSNLSKLANCSAKLQANRTGDAAEDEPDDQTPELPYDDEDSSSEAA